MKKIKGFTLIELLIVVAIIAILAAIAVPNFLEAQIRSKVSRVKADQRSVATALESYYVDNNCYPAWAADPTMDKSGTIKYTDPVLQRYNVNYGLKAAGGTSNTAAAIRALAITPGLWSKTSMMTITTPIAYMSSIPADPFMSTRGAMGGYYTDPASTGWILFSPGPDVDEAKGMQLDVTVYYVYQPWIAQPSQTLIGGADQSSAKRGSYTYDPTNGTSSAGDVYRVKA